MERQIERCSGNALVAVLVGTLVVSGLLYGSLVTTTADLRTSVLSLDEVRTESLAKAGVERAINELRNAARKLNAINPLGGIQALFASGDYVPFVGTQLLVDGQVYGEFSVSIAAVAHGSEGLDLTIDSTGYYPTAPVHTPPGAAPSRRKSVRVSVFVGLEQSRVFDSGYFINNWGWFYGSNIYCHGNAGSNGQFDVANYSPTITGQPTYDGLTLGAGTAALSGYRDDNLDGLQDGGDGGIFSGWDVVGAGTVVGNGGQAKNQHEFEERIEMPNLTNLSLYEAKAIAAGAGSKVKAGATTLFTGVYGDDVSEKQNLYLVGTVANPIEITGTVVVRGSVVISGVIKGKGAIYAGGNVYVPNNLQYENPPTTSRPASNSQADTETWLAANATKDFVALMARENVVLGNHTNGTWRSYVSGWLGHSMNRSDEDAGEDLIPNTTAGKDGSVGTEDDDVLEDDHVFTVETYTAADEALGLIPAGLSVGSVIPGSGEDIDGDGAYDDTLTLSDLDLPAPLNTGNWGGTISSAVNYNTISSNAMTRLDGVFYTNHAFAWLTVPSAMINCNGAIVSRNETIIYGGPGLRINYDCRLLGGSGSMIGDMLPRTLGPFTVQNWMDLDWDPNNAISN